MFSKEIPQFFLVTVFSTSDGDAPGYIVATVITFCSNFGLF
jgi:hypothetical protein